MNILDYVKKYSLPDGFIDIPFLTDGDWEYHNWYSRTPDNNDKTTIEKNDPLTNSICFEHTNNFVMPMVFKLIEEYAKEVGKFLTIQNASIPKLNSYSEKTFLKEHIDHIHDVFYDAPVYHRGVPVLSIIGNISKKKYEGGELYVCGKDMNLKPGECIIFPSSFMYPHEVKPITSGIRDSFIVWAW